jgi:hypothetical protein
VVVHHTFCGTTAFTPYGLYGAYQQEQGQDITHLHAPELAREFDRVPRRGSPCLPAQLHAHSLGSVPRLARHSRHHDRSAVLVRQHRAAAATGHLARHPACGLLRHQNRLNLSQQTAAFGKRESQVGNAAILPLDHLHDRCFSCGGARLRTLEAGFDN